ncbi:MAG: DNA gyrase subunit B [Eubacteriales bacterium]|nr:DNA gyrase subunit B [Eubacteriales bacterium]
MAKKYDADSISVLEGLEAVRVRPGMYIGSVSNRGLNHLVYEIVDNGVDEHLAGACDRIEVVLQADGGCRVTDNGRGIPVDMHSKGMCAERLIFTTLHAGGKFDHESYGTSGGLHGVGSSVVNALSKRMEVTVWRDGYEYFDAYEFGKPVVPLEAGMLPRGKRVKRTGTTVLFYPDDTIFETTSFKGEWLKNRLHETAYLNPALTIHYRDEREEEAEDILFHEPEGIVAFVRDMTEGKNRTGEVVSVRGEVEGIEVRIAYAFTEGTEEHILGFCNNIATVEGGTHLTGFKTRFTSLVNQYARSTGILKEKDENFTGNDTRSGMHAVIAVKQGDPLFEGQTKTKLSGADVGRAVSAVVGDELTIYFDINTVEVRTMLEHIRKVAKARKASEKAKANIITKERFSCQGNGKLSNCESRKASECELFIVEGDSAGGSAKSARNRRFQAVLPIRGKILNVEKAAMDRVLANAEIKTLIQTLGCGFSEGYGHDFDMEKLRYDKIIIMTDADVDGSHIDTLLLTFFYRFMPELIIDGHVYIALPPLYQATLKNGMKEYLFDERALAKFKEEHKQFTLTRFKGLGEMDAKELRETTLDPKTRRLKRIMIEDLREANRLTEVLMGNDVGKRRAFIMKHGDKARIDL